jgi:hypothetical protein
MAEYTARIGRELWGSSEHVHVEPRLELCHVLGVYGAAVIGVEDREVPRAGGARVERRLLD